MTNATGNQLPAMTSSTACSPELWRRLTVSAGDSAQAWAEVINDRALREEFGASLAVIAARTRPASPKEVVSVLARYIPIFGVGDRSAEEWATFWEVYIETLDGLPLEAIREGAKAYAARADAERFPKPGPLRELCSPAAAKLKIAMMAAAVISAVTPLSAHATERDRRSQLAEIGEMMVRVYRDGAGPNGRSSRDQQHQEQI